MNRGKSTAILAAVAAVLGGYIVFVERHRTPAPAALPDGPVGKVFAGVDAAKIQDVTIARGDQTATLRKVGDTWRVVAPVDAPADPAEVSNITTNLASADIQRIVDEQPKDLAAFGLTTPRMTLTFTVAGEAAPRVLQIGNKNPTGSDLYAKLPAAPRVFLISGYLESNFDKNGFQLRDKTLLAFDREKVDRIDLVAAAGTASVARRSDVWSVTAPAAARADFGVIEAVLSRLANGQMKAIAWDPAAPGPTRTLKEFGLDPAERRVTLAAGSATAELLLGKATPEGDVYAKDASRPLVFVVEKALADDLVRDPADFRTKDLFAFRAFTGTRLDIVRGGTTAAFERKKGPEADAVEKWVAVPPTKAADEATIEDLVAKVATLRAESFVAAVPAGATEFARIQAASDQGRKKEAAVIHLAGADYYAVREGDAGAALAATQK
jgi:hypothetical protein